MGSGCAVLSRSSTVLLSPLYGTWDEPEAEDVSELGAHDDELVIERLVRDLPVRLRLDLALEPAKSRVLGHEVNHLGPLLPLGLEPARKGSPGLGEDGGL